MTSPKIFFLTEEEDFILKNTDIKENHFINVSDLKSLECDILFVHNKTLLKDFIRDIFYEEHNLLETENIEFIIIGDLELFNLIASRFSEIIDVKIEESYLNGQKYKKLFRFFRIGDKKLYNVVKNFRRFYYVEDVNGEFTAIDGKKVRKEYDYYLEGVKDYEKDVNMMLRYSLIRVKNKKVKFGKNLRVCTYDLETQADVDCINTPRPIISLAAYDNFTKEMYYWDIKNIGTSEKPEYNSEEEKKMLEDFFVFVSKFDILSGFNIQNYDVPFLLNRAKKIGANTSLITGIKDIYPTTKYRGKEAPIPWFIVIPGINVIDLKGLSEKVTGYLDTKLSDKKLETLGMAILGEGKIKEIATPAVLWANKDYETLQRYNEQDVNVTYKVDEKLGLIEMLLATVEIIPGINIDAAVWNSKIAEFYLMSNFNNIIMPSVDRNREATVKGAVVLTTVPGIHEKVGVFDFQSMYPNLILSLNISYDTKDKNGDINIDGVRFTSSKEGIFVNLVKKCVELRKYYKQQKKIHENDSDYKMFQLKEFMIKKLSASIYGISAYKGFRWFDEEIANAITGAGRSCLLFVKDLCEKEGYQVIFGDTDGLGVKKISGEPDFEYLEKKINDSLKDWMRKFTSTDEIINNHKMICENETIFLRVIFTTAKKTYIGLVSTMKGKKLEVPQLYGKGNFLIRKDTPAGMKKELEKIVMAILNNSDKENNLQIIKDKVIEVKKSMSSWTKDDLIIYKEINRNFDDYKVKPIHVKASIFSNKYLNTSFSREDYKGGYIFVKSRRHPEVDVLFMNDNTKMPEEFCIDYEKYFEKFIMKKILLTFGKDIYNKVFSKDRCLIEFC